jgi:hypothetical protein
MTLAQTVTKGSENAYANGLIRAYRQSDVVWMIQIWNEVVLEGNAFAADRGAG